MRPKMPNLLTADRMHPPLFDVAIRASSARTPSHGECSSTRGLAAAIRPKRRYLFDGVSARLPAPPGPAPHSWHFAVGPQMPPPAGDVDQHRDHQHDDHPENDRDVDPASEWRRV